MRTQTGVAWLSYHGQAPVLPVGFGGTSGAMGKALRAAQIAQVAEAILNYLVGQNEYFLIYRFDPKEGEAMQLGLEELQTLARWADQQGLTLILTPIRRYYSPDLVKEIVQTEQEPFKGWM